MEAQKGKGPRNDSGTERLKYLISKSSSTSSSNSYSALVEIRLKFITKPKFLKLFIELGGLKILVEQLSKTNKKVIDVSISILGHCVREDGQAREMFHSYGGLPPLVKLLDSLDERNIQLRTCTAIGSIAKDRKACSLLMDLSAHVPIGRLIDTSEDEETLRVALRALSALADRQTHIAIFSWDQIPRKIWLLLERTESEPVLKFTLQALNNLASKFAHYEKHKYSWIDPLLSGKYMKRLIGLSDHSQSSISTSVLTLMQRLVREQHVREVLANQDSFGALVPLIAEGSERHGWKTLLTSACLMCRENPGAFFKAGGIPVLMDLVKTSDPRMVLSDGDLPEDEFSRKLRQKTKLESCHELLFNTLLTFEHDRDSLTELVTQGVVPILTCKLTDFIDDVSTENESAFDYSEAIIQKEQVMVQEEEVDEIDEENTEEKTHCTGSTLMRSFRQYRITSPSYQAVGEEFDQLMRFRAARESEALNIFGWNPNIQQNGGFQSLPSSPQSSLSRQGSESDLSELADSLPSPSFSVSSPSHSGTMSPVHSDRSSPSELSEMAFSPFVPDSGSDLSDEELNADEETVCYSPVDSTQTTLLSKSPSPVPPPTKLSRRMKTTEMGTNCCSDDVACASVQLGDEEKVEWPVFRDDKQLKRTYSDWALHLLQRLSWLPETPVELTEKSFVDILIKYLRETKHPSFRACRVLFRLASHSKVFKRLLYSEFALAVFTNLVAGSSTECCRLHACVHQVGVRIITRLQAAVDTFGKGELENILLKKMGEPVALSTALAAPIIVRSKRILQRLLVDLGGFDLLFEGLENRAAAVESVASISSLAVALGLRLNDEEPVNFFSKYPNACVAGHTDGDFSVHLSSGETVVVDKNLLKKSDYFNAMLSGEYEESLRGSVQLEGISITTLGVLLHFIYGCGVRCKTFSKVLTLPPEEEVELLRWSDQLLLFDLQRDLMVALSQRSWSLSHSFPANFLHFVNSLFGVEFSSSDQLRDNLLKYLLIGPLPLKQKAESLGVLLRSQNGPEILVLIKKLLKNELDSMKF